jgi:hypothetical protein
MISKNVKKLAAAGLSAAVIVGGVVSVQNIGSADDGTVYRLVNADKRDEGWGGIHEMCLDGNLAAPKPIPDGALFAHPCKTDSRYQLWRQVGNGADGMVFRNLGSNKGGELCLDGDDIGDAYVGECNGGNFQKWILVDVPYYPNVKQLQNVQTKLCLAQQDSHNMYHAWSGVKGRACERSETNQIQRWELRTVSEVELASPILWPP